MIKVNDYPIGNECFPNNERILKIPIIYDTPIYIEMKYTTDIDIAVLSMVKKYLDDNFDNPVELIMLYVPYSRMDRIIKGHIFSLKYFCKLINDLNFSNVMILDPHSNVTPALLNRCEELNINPYIKKIFLGINIDYVFFPDAGAMKRYSEILELPNNTPYFYGNKKRDLVTGKIIDFKLVGCPDIKDKNVLIIDDLCAKGYTFFKSAEKIKEKGANNIYLYVSHCEDSIYKGELLKSGLISKIFTTDSLLTDWSSPLIYNLNETFEFCGDGIYDK